nr:unnamed protein product [Callosobruchus analis]
MGKLGLEEEVKQKLSWRKTKHLLYGKENSYDPYVREQQRLRRLFEEVSSGEEDLQEPFEDDGEFGSDENYVPSETELEQSSSDADDQNPDSDHEGSDSSPGEERFDENDFQNAYGPNKELSLDESLLHFRGRLLFRVYIKGKKDKYGIKFIELATSDGYVLNIVMYSGAEHKDVNMTKTTALVLRLLKPYLMKGHDVFMDNYYNSVELSEKLLNLRTHTNGTLRSNRRGNPKQLVKKKLKKGEHFWLRKKYVYISKWKDKRDVLMITTRNHPQLITSKNRFGKEKVKPEEVVVYNDHMSGIDRCDQMTSTYCSPRKTICWYKKVLFYLLDVAVWNSFYLYRKYCKENSKKYTFMQFGDILITALLKLPENAEGIHMVRKSKNDCRRFESQQSMATEGSAIPEKNEDHWPEKIPGVPGPKSGKKSVFL